MNLSDIAIRKHVFTWMLMAGLILFGGLCFREMGVSELPDVDFPLVNVRVNLEGAAPEIMEIQVIDPIESAVMSVEGIKSISSSARQGSANVTVEFELSKDIDVAVQEIQTRIAQAQRRLPDDIEPPIVTKQNPEDRPIVWLSVRSEGMSTREMMEFVRDRLKDRFSTLPGVADVNLGGYLEPNLRVWVSAEKMRRYALTVEDIMSTIQREHHELPAGRIETPDREIGVRMLGEASSVKEFESLLIQSRGGAPSWKPIVLSEVSDIEDSLEDARRRSRTEGKPSVGIGIIKQRGANAVAVGDAVKAKLKELQAELPPTVQITVNFDSTQFIKEAVEELLFTLLLAAILTALVCWAFLGSWSATINVILAIPTSIVGAFIVLKFLNFTLNTFTLLGLSLAIGIVVDDAIMVLENIVRHMEMKKGRLQAAIVGTREISFAALAASLAIVAIFLPVAYMKGLIGRYFFQFGVTISVAVMLSLLEALTLTPMRCSRFLDMESRGTRIGKMMEAIFQWWERTYASSLKGALNHPWLVITAAVVTFVASLFVVQLLNREFVPSQDQGRLMVRLKAPEGSSIGFTDGKVREAEAMIAKWPEVETYFVSVGGFGGGEVNTANAFVTLKPKGKRGIDPVLKREPSQADLAQKMRKEFGALKGVKAYVQDMSQGGLGGRRGFPLEFVVQGNNWEDLVKGSEWMMEELEKTGLVTDVNSDFVAGVPELKVEPDREKAARYGVSVGQIGETLNALVGGVVAGMYTKDGKRYDIRVRLREEERDRVEALSKLSVRNNRGELVNLSELVHIREGTGPLTITRLNRARSIGVNANIAQGASQATAIAKVRELGLKLPKGCFVTLSGSAETFEESFRSLWFALGLGVIVAYMILASQFNSFIHPFTVLVALPLSVSGAFVALWAGGQSLNVYSMIGLILLMGIVKKNSILLVDFTNQCRDEGMAVRAALEKACPQRLRPIVMTSVSTVAAAVPAAFNFGPGAETRIPMALTVIGGVTISTLLTLYVVPAVYQLLPGKVGAEAEREIARLDLNDQPPHARAG